MDYDYKKFSNAGDKPSYYYSKPFSLKFFYLFGCLIAYSLPACAAVDNSFGHASLAAQGALQSTSIPDFNYSVDAVTTDMLPLPSPELSGGNWQAGRKIASAAPLPLPPVKSSVAEKDIQAVSALSEPGIETTEALTADIDKSGYDLFSPVPDAAMRAFAPDRPAKATGPYTVDAGHFQVESDLVNGTYSHNSQTNVSTSQWVTADPTLKLGVTNNMDLELNFTSFVDSTTKDKSAGTSQSVNGIGDLIARAKINLLGNDSGNYALAVAPYVKVPVAHKSIGNGYYEGGVAVPLAITLPDDWVATYTGEVDILENAASNGVHSGVQNIIALSHPLTKSLTGTVELADNLNMDRVQSDQLTVDFGLAWAVEDNLQLDAGINAGTTRDAPDAQAYIGISSRF